VSSHTPGHTHTHTHNLNSRMAEGPSIQPIPSDAPTTVSPAEGSLSNDTDAAFAEQVARLAEICGPGCVCESTDKFVEDLVHFMHYGNLLADSGHEGLRQYHESSLDGSDATGVFHVEDAYDLAFKYLYQSKSIPFGPSPPPRFTVRNVQQMTTTEVLAAYETDYEDAATIFDTEMWNRAPLLSHGETADDVVSDWARHVLMMHPQVCTAAAKLPHYPTFFDAMAAMRDPGCNVVSIPAPNTASKAPSRSDEPVAISDESLICIAKKAGVMCLDREVYDLMRQLAEEYLVRVTQRLTASPNASQKGMLSAQHVQEALVATDRLTVLGYGYKG
jgi:hypothetical protein